jgi:hypothetical protein
LLDVFDSGMLQRFEIELFPYRNLSFLDPDRMDNLWKAHS